MADPIIIANWKLNLNLAERAALAKQVKRKLGRLKSREIVVCPPFLSLVQTAEIFKGSSIRLGAQDVFWEKTGAYTGEISPEILNDLNCRYAIIGHSERRRHLGETDKMVNQKIAACLENRLTPIVCLGEELEERREGRAENLVLLQLKRALAGIDLVASEELVIAYEPVWAIGSGQPVSSEQAGEMFQFIRRALTDFYPQSIITGNIRLIYGGSVTPENAGNFSRLEFCQGFLVGGASLDADSFTKIAKVNFNSN